MSKRLPQPGQPKRVRLVVEDAELARLDVMAAESRLSVASFVRAMCVCVIDTWPQHQQAIKAAAERVAASASPDKPKPGRPKKPKGK